jgi:hypothetical protein
MKGKEGLLLDGRVRSIEEGCGHMGGFEPSLRSVDAILLWAMGE